MPSNTEILQQLATAIFNDTQHWHAEGAWEESLLPTAADLARQFGYRLDTIKKSLRILKEGGLIQPTGHMPKRYRFDEWIFRTLSEDHPLYEVVNALNPTLEESL